MNIENIIAEDKDLDYPGLPKIDYQKESMLLSRLDHRNELGHSICDNLITIVMRHRKKGVSLISDIRKMIAIREYDKAEKMLEEVDSILNYLRTSKLLKNIEKEITIHL